MSFTIRKSYSKYSLKTKYTYKKYREVLEMLLYELSKAIIYDKYTFLLPYGGGAIRIIKVVASKNKKHLDYKYYKQTGEKRYLLNRHTNGFYFMWNWNTSKCKYRNCKLYRMVPVRGNDNIIGTRGLAKHIIECSKNPYVKDYDALTVK